MLISIYGLKTAGRINFGGHISIIDQGSVVCSRIRSERSGVRNPVKERSFLFFITSRPAQEPTQSHIQWIWGSFMGVKRPGSDVNH
jgi:hypothetical protein